LWSCIDVFCAVWVSCNEFIVLPLKRGDDRAPPCYLPDEIANSTSCVMCADWCIFTLWPWEGQGQAD
jgi:hypothetical protein